MSITCRYYKKTDFGKTIDIIQKISERIPEGGSEIYERADEEEGKTMRLKIHNIRKKENEYGTLLVLAVDNLTSVTDYATNGEEKFTIRTSVIVPIQLFNNTLTDYVGVVCPKWKTDTTINALNSLLMFYKKKPFESCEINMHSDGITEELKRFWVSQLNDHHSKSASVSGAHLRVKDDWKRYVHGLKGQVNAIRLAHPKDFDYGISRDGHIWLTSNHMDDIREKFITEVLKSLVSRKVIN